MRSELISIAKLDPIASLVALLSKDALLLSLSVKYRVKNKKT